MNRLDGQFPWGNPAMGRPKISILGRSPVPGAAHLSRVMAEVEIGIEDSLRFSFNAASADDLATIRAEALNRACDRLGLHLENAAHLVEVAEAFGTARVWADDVMALPNQFGQA